MLYDDDPITKQLKQSPWGDQAEDVWGAFKQQFPLRAPEWRVWDLNAIDQWLAQEDRVTHDHARLLNMRRELGGIHSAMRKAGR
jgi:hypothetical protein